MGRKLRYFTKEKTVIGEKIKEALSSVVPITFIVLILCFALIPMETGILIAFLIGSLVVAAGMGFFTLGADIAMTPIGQYVGTTVIKSRKIWIIAPVIFVIGIIITMAEPDLQVLAKQLSATVNATVLTVAVGVGVGLFLVFAFLRIVLKLKLSMILLICYGLVFILSIFVPAGFVPMSFDAGGVTTGPMSVPFIIALGTGFASMRSDDAAEKDSFGLTALCSVGPIIAVMILGIIFNPQTINVEKPTVVNYTDSVSLFSAFAGAFPEVLKEVAMALVPIFAFYIVFKIFGHRQEKQEVFRIIVGVIYTYVGLVLFLVGVKVGFLPVGNMLGKMIGEKPYNWILIPIGAVLGFFVVAAEPAVHVLNEQVYEITDGAIPKKALLFSLEIGVAVSVALAMARIVLHIPILYVLLPGYAIALALMFVVPDMFTAVAYDSGGVASGAMTASFLLPFALGACSVLGGDAALATEGFGVVAMVAMTPLIAIQILGLIYKIKLKKISTVGVFTQKDGKERIIG